MDDFVRTTLYHSSQDSQKVLPPQPEPYPYPPPPSPHASPSPCAGRAYPTSVPTPHHPHPVQGVLLYACDSIEQHEHRESLLLLLVLLMHQVRGSSSSSSSSTPPPRPAHAPG
jgi:hypothetical protein